MIKKLEAPEIYDTFLQAFQAIESKKLKRIWASFNVKQDLSNLIVILKDQISKLNQSLDSINFFLEYLENQNQDPSLAQQARQIQNKPNPQTRLAGNKLPRIESQKESEFQNKLGKEQEETKIKKTKIFSPSETKTSNIDPLHAKNQSIDSSSYKPNKEQKNSQMKNNSCRLVSNSINNYSNKFLCIVENIYQILNSNKADSEKLQEIMKSLQKDLLSMKEVKKHLSKILNQCFKFNISASTIKKQQSTSQDLIKSGFQLFHQYYAFIKKSEGLSNKEIDANQFLDFCKTLVNKSINSFYWTNQEQKCFLEILMSQDNIKPEKIVEFLKVCEPPLEIELHTKNMVQTLLCSILTKIKQKNSQIYLDVLSMLIHNQKIDLNKKISDYDQTSYLDVLKDIYPLVKIKKLFGQYFEQAPEEKQSKFLLINMQEKEIQELALQKDIQDKIVLFVKNEIDRYFKQSIHDYEIQINCVNQCLQIKMNINDYAPEGILIPKYLCQHENVTWRVFNSTKYEFITLSKSQSEFLHEKLKSQKLITFKVNNHNAKLTINQQTNNTKIQYLGNDFEGQIECDDGLIFWIPNKCFDKQVLPTQQSDQPEVENPGQTVQNYFNQQPKVQVLLNIKPCKFKHLGILFKHIQAPPEISISKNDKDNSVVAQNQESKEYLDNWINQQMYYILKKCFDDSGLEKDKLKLERLRIKLKNEKNLLKMKENLENIQNKYKFNMKLSVIEKNNQIIFENIVSNQQFVKHFCQYLQAIYQDEEQSVSLTIDMGNNAQRLEIIQNAMNNQSTYPSLISQKKSKLGVQNLRNQVQIQTSNQEMEQVLQMFEQKDITRQFQEIDALNQLTRQNQELISMTNVKIDRIDQEKFTATGKPQNIFAFYNLLLPFIKKVAKQNYQLQKVEIYQKDAAQDYEIYQQIMSEFPKTFILIIQKDLIIHTTKKQHPYILIKLKEDLLLKKIEAIQKNPLKFQFKWIQMGIANSFNIILEKRISEVKNSTGMKPTIKMTPMQNPKGVIFELINGNDDAKQVFTKIMKFLVSRFIQYSKIWKNIRNNSKILNSQLLDLRSISAEQKDMKQVLKQMQRKYYKYLSEILNTLATQKQSQLTQQFRKFISEGNQSKQFLWKPEESIEDQLRKKNQGIFNSFLQQEIQKAKQKKVFAYHQTSKKVQKIKQIISPKIKQLDQSLIDGKLHKQAVIPMIISTRTLVTMLLTLKLPIVPHLSHFKKLIESKDNIIVKTGTGSGKSTVLPPFIIALGFKKVIVTQPRRLPCRAIYQRICDTFFRSLVGYSYSGSVVDNHHPLQYITDGLLNEILNYKPEMIKDVDVLMLDQIHERSKSIDMILLKINELKAINPKLKVILCSATVDQKVMQIVGPQNSFHKFEVQVQTHPVKQVRIQKESILERANNLSAKLTRDDKMLVFFAGTDEVRKNIQCFEKTYKKKAYPLYSNQSPKLQDQYLLKGQIFFATSIAETSLTFSGLKYVLDTRKSRTTIFNATTGLYQLKEFPSSQSSIIQRRGRVGRDCPGQYHYVESIQEKDKNSRFNFSQLQRVDLTQVIFEMLSKCKSLDQVTLQLKKVISNENNKHTYLQKRIEFARPVLQYYGVLNWRKERTTFFIQSLLPFGSLGSISYNYALYQSKKNNCTYQIICIIAFMMYGSNILKDILEIIPDKLRHQSGDIMTVAQFLITVCEDIKLKLLSADLISEQLDKLPKYRRKNWTSTLVKILTQIKRFMGKMQVVQCRNWKKVAQILISKAFKNNLYFNEEVMGGRKRNYQKLFQDTTYCFQKPTLQKNFYIIHKQSLLSKRQSPPNVVISLIAFANTVQTGILNFCSEIYSDLIQTKTTIELIRCNVARNLNNATINQSGILRDATTRIRGPFKQVLPEIVRLENARKNSRFVIKMKDILEQKIGHIKQQKKNKLRQFMEKIDLKQVFSSFKFQLENIYNTKSQFSYPNNPNKTITLVNTKASVINMVLEKIDGFFTWFIGCQYLCVKDMKSPIRQLKKDSVLSENEVKQIEKRVNMLVDSQLDYHIVKNWVDSKNHDFKPRTMRMVAVSWILVNKFHCVIKGGFIRDFVVRGYEWLPSGDLSNLMSKCPRNNYIQVNDQRVTPSDIDAELPLDRKWFDCKYFQNQVTKLGITVKIQEDGWRKHVIFDEKSPTGGFTADLIQSYCYISHDQVDFDVNSFYVKKDYLNGLGLKIPMNLRILNDNNNNNKQFQISLQDLVKSCRQQKMRPLKLDIYNDRLKKFENRGWKIDKIAYQPTIYKNFQTTYYKIPVQKFFELCPKFRQDLPNANILQVQILKNYGWQMSYDANVEWINKQKCNTNQKLLFHGTNPEGKTGICNNGFDLRFGGRVGSFFGYGFYFADHAQMSHGYTEADGSGCRYMFVCRVALGKMENIYRVDNTRNGTSPGHHSLLGQKSPGAYNQYIINRTGQARPLYLIKYRG